MKPSREAHITAIVSAPQPHTQTKAPNTPTPAMFSCIFLSNKINKRKESGELRFGRKMRQVRGLQDGLCCVPSPCEKGASEKERQKTVKWKWWKGEGHVVKRWNKGWMKQEQELEITRELFECCKHQGGKRIV